MSGELNQKEVEQIQGICKEQGIVPVSNIPNEDLRLNELKRLNIMDKDLGQDPRFSSLTEVASYLTECRYSAINILGSTFQRCKIIFGLSKEEEKDFEWDEPRDLAICQFSLKTPHQPFDPPSRTASIYDGESALNVPNLNTPPPGQTINAFAR